MKLQLILKDCSKIKIHNLRKLSLTKYYLQNWFISQNVFGKSRLIEAGKSRKFEHTKEKSRLFENDILFFISEKFLLSFKSPCHNFYLYIFLFYINFPNIQIGTDIRSADYKKLYTILCTV